MSNPLIRKLEHGACFTDDDRAVLEAIYGKTRHINPGHDILEEGSLSDTIYIITHGFGCRYNILSDGSRQITAFLLPGDICNLNTDLLLDLDYMIGTIRGCDVLEVSRTFIGDICNNNPRIMRALQWSLLVDEAILRKWLVNMGQYSANRQMAHLFCELLVRLQTVGYADDNSFDFPISQVELGETLGLSTVHVNRILQDLRSKNLVSWKNKRVMIPDVKALKIFAGFNHRYLYLKKHPVV